MGGMATNGVREMGTKGTIIATSSPEDIANVCGKVDVIQ